MTDVHPSALIDPKAELDDTVRVGPYCVVGPRVTLSEGVVLHSHVVVEGTTRIGPKTEIYPFASIGHRPQDLKFAGEESRLEIGANNMIRENATMNPGTTGGGLVTKIGDNCLFMAGSHVAHDCIVGDHVIFANLATAAGHCVIGDFAMLGGLSASHQFVRIGKHAFVGGMSGVENDVIPYGSVLGNRAHLAGLNIIGLKRRGFSREKIHSLRAAYRLLFAQEGTLRERLEDVASLFKDNPEAMEIVEFIRADSDRAICVPRQERAA